VTLREAVGFAAQHGGRMDLVLDGDTPGSFVGHHGKRVHTPGDGGFMVGQTVIEWDRVQSWTLHLTAHGNEHASRETSSMPSYDCPRCGARDSGESGGQCHFRIGVMTGQIAPSQQEDARAAGCRVQHYTDLKTKTEED
jgi:hypothetical protein